MTDELPVHVNRDGIHSVEAPPAVDVTGRFTVELHNHGAATHVHLQLDDALSTVASVEVANHYVEADAVRPVTVALDEVEDPVTGTLTILTGYGQEEATVRVTVEPPTDESVVVDESLSEPADAEGPTADQSTDQPPTTAAAGTAAAALVILGALLLLDEGAAMVVGVIVVLASVAAAAYFVTTGHDGLR